MCTHFNFWFVTNHQLLNVIYTMSRLYRDWYSVK